MNAKPLPTAEEMVNIYDGHPSPYRTARIQAVLDHLKPWLSQPVPSGLPWVSLKERRPTRQDADKSGDIIVTYGVDFWSCPWDAPLTGATHFLSFSPPVRPDTDREDFEREFGGLDYTKAGDGPFSYVDTTVNALWSGFKRARELARKEAAQ